MSQILNNFSLKQSPLACYHNIGILKLVGSFESQSLCALAVAITSAQNEIPDNNKDMFVLPSTQI